MIVDIIIIGIVIISAIVSFLRGFIREILTIFGVLGGIVVAFLFGASIETQIYDLILPSDFTDGDKLFNLISYEIAATGISYGGLFIIVVIALSILSHFLAESASEYGLGAIDRTLGVFFGVARGALIVGLLYLPVHIFINEEDKKEWFKDSQSIFYVETTSRIIASLVPAINLDEEKDTGRTAKEVMEKMDILKDDDKEKINEIKETVKEEITKKADGYKEEIRDTMDSLIKKQIMGTYEDEKENPANINQNINE